MTGLYPDRHGTVNNSMQDPALGHFSPANRAANTDGRWWDEAEPILADGAQGRCTACSFLARAAAEIHGVRPDYDARGIGFDRTATGNTRPRCGPGLQTSIGFRRSSCSGSIMFHGTTGCPQGIPCGMIS